MGNSKSKKISQNQTTFLLGKDSCNEIKFIREELKKSGAGWIIINEVDKIDKRISAALQYDPSSKPQPPKEYEDIDETGDLEEV